LGENVELVVFHDASLFNTVGVEIDEQEADDILLNGTERKLVYSQKGAVIGLIRRGDIEVAGRDVPMNVLDWKSTTNKKVVESSPSAETHSAIMAHGLGRFLQALITEAKFGQDFLTIVDEDEWQDVIPMNMITDSLTVNLYVIMLRGMANMLVTRVG